MKRKPLSQWTVRDHLAAAVIVVGLSLMLVRFLGYLGDVDAEEACRERGGYLVKTFGGSGWTCARLEPR